MDMETLERSLQAHPFLAGLATEHVHTLAGCAKNARFRPGEFLIREGDREDTLFLLRQGSVAIEVTKPAGPALTVETLEAGDVLGIAQLTPVASHLDCRARDTVLAFAIDNECLHAKMSLDPAFGYALTTRLLARTYDRLRRARLQHVDVYR
jgi:CRP-like cAMP-binding protein